MPELAPLDNIPGFLHRDSELITPQMEWAGIMATTGRLEPDWPMAELARDVFVDMMHVVLKSPDLRGKYLTLLANAGERASE